MIGHHNCFTYVLQRYNEEMQSLYIALLFQNGSNYKRAAEWKLIKGTACQVCHSKIITSITLNLPYIYSNNHTPNIHFLLCTSQYSSFQPILHYYTYHSHVMKLWHVSRYRMES